MIRRRIVFWALGALLVLAPLASTRIQGKAGQAGQAAPARIVALRGGTVLTVTKGTIPNGTVILRDGKIAAVGANVAVPSGAEVIDTTGQFVSPGIIDAHSHIANDAINEGGTTVSSMTGHGRRARPDRHQHLSRPRRRPDRRQRSARQRQPDRRQEPGDQTALGEDAGRGDRLRGRDAGDQVRPRREPQGHADRSADRTAPLSDDAHGRRVRDPRRVHPRQGVPEGVEGVREEQDERNRARRRAATCSSSRSSKSSRASASCTPTATGQTRSS